MNILIVGGGIAGTALAGLLTRQNHAVTLVDRNPGDGGAGYVLGLWPLGSRVLRMLGLYDAFEDASVPLHTFRTALPNGDILNAFVPAKIVASLGEIRMVKRSALVQVLARGCSTVKRKAPLSVETLRQDESGVNVCFNNGETERFDLVLGCDGVNSQIRHLVFENAPASETNWYGWGWWIDPSECEAHTMTEYWDPGHRFVAVYPAKDVACAFAGLPTAALPTAELRADLDQIKACFADMGGAVPSALAALNDSSRVFQDAFRTVVSDNWVNGRVVLVGDAASAYFPYGGLGLGASMALESVAVLADELSRANPDCVTTSLAFYEHRRLNRVRQFEETGKSIVKLMLHTTKTPKGEDLLESQRSHFRVLRSLLESPM